MGNTRVICAASVEDKLPPHLRYQRTEGWVTAEYGMLPRSTHTRSQRETGRGGPSCVLGLGIPKIIARRHCGAASGQNTLPFEIASLLLLVAIIGSVMLARTLKQEVAADDVDPDTLLTAASVRSLEVETNE